MADLDRRAIAREIGALADDVATAGAAFARMQARLVALRALFETPPTPEVMSSSLPDTEDVLSPQDTQPLPCVQARSGPDPEADFPAEEVGAKQETVDAPPQQTFEAWTNTPPPSTEGSAPVLPDLPEIELPDLYPWQMEALEAWRRADRVGVVEAVTGAGKTRVGLAALAEALMDGLRVVVMTPTQGLVSQWEAQVRELFPGVRVSTDATRSPGWHVLVDTVQTLAHKNPLWPDERALLVADEAHRYGAPTFAWALRPNFSQRLGLSATFERGDEGDTDVLLPYFNGVCFRLGYERALAEELIAPFRVAQLGVPLSPPERAEYDAVSDGLKRAWRVLAGNLGGDSPSFVEVLMYAQQLNHQHDHPAASSARAFLAAFARRRDVLARVAAKVAALDSLAPAVIASGGTIVFTGTTASATEAAEVLNRAGCESAAVHGELGRDEREERLELLRSGQTRSISAPRILDEGVDIPDADLGIILGASKTRRQMIQRLGRVVRKKSDGRYARLVILYAIETSEDPGVEEVPPHLEEIIANAQAAIHLRLPENIDEALAFLRGTPMWEMPPQEGVGHQPPCVACAES
ncbi:DEAD/DEAH box helicase [Gephyromycinifex aptenodytis]|uniref:DEAD/DEAH box helicase n=1 Tax=Gephyromycinifex aptenodytis TaxID=2716227 RepID=UPI0014470CFA|nr:DEAD/DEAH box helicase [Gephyromycinifex aptenodytis]